MDAGLDRLLRASDVASALNVGRSMAYQLLNTELPAVRIGRCLRVRESDLRAWIERQAATDTAHDVDAATGEATP